MKVLSLGKIRELVNLIQNNSIPTEENYFLEITESQATYTVPAYKAGKSLVEVYKNGFRLCEGEHYDVSQKGIITLKDKAITLENYLHVVHKKYK